jgi:anti-sigma factor RsiW
MKPCTDPTAETLLNLYVDGELPSARQAPLFAHLAACSACRAQFSVLLQFRGAVRRESFAVPPAADEAFLARIDRMRRASHPAPDRAAERRRLSIPRRMRVPFGTALLAAVLVATLGLLIRITPEAAPAAPAYRLTETVTDDGNALYIIDPGITVVDRKL